MGYSILDHPAIGQILFHPRQGWTALPPGASDHLVEVEEGLSLSCRFYPGSKAAPNILYFHGNGELACDYDWIAPLYHREDINLFVADYRGYGRSGGSPSFSSMVADSHPIYRYFSHLLAVEGYASPSFVMGRSLGAHPALELAQACPEKLSGLIVESGFADPSHMLRLLGGSGHQREAMSKSIVERLKSIVIPTLILHGEEDELVPLAQARFLLDNLGSGEKCLVVIPGAGHNDIMLVGVEEYFRALRGFVRGHRR